MTKGQPLALLQQHRPGTGDRQARRPASAVRDPVGDPPPREAPRPQAAAQIPEVAEALETVRRTTGRKRGATSSGCGLWPRRRHRPAAAGHRRPANDPEGQLPSWSGTPLDPENRGAYPEGRKRKRHVLPDRRSGQGWRRTWSIDQGDIEYVPQEGQEVDIKLDAHRRTTRCTARSSEIADTKLKVARNGFRRRPAATWPPRPTRRPASSGRRARPTRHASRWKTPKTCMRSGLRGRGKVHADWMSLGERLWRLVTPHVQLQAVGHHPLRQIARGVRRASSRGLGEDLQIARRRAPRDTRPNIPLRPGGACRRSRAAGPGRFDQPDRPQGRLQHLAVGFVVQRRHAGGNMAAGQPIQRVTPDPCRAATACGRTRPCPGRWRCRALPASGCGGRSVSPWGLAGDGLVVVELAAHDVRIEAHAADVLAHPVDQQHVGRVERQPGHPLAGQGQQCISRARTAGSTASIRAVSS